MGTSYLDDHKKDRFLETLSKNIYDGDEFALKLIKMVEDEEE